MKRTTKLSVLKELQKKTILKRKNKMYNPQKSKGKTKKAAIINSITPINDSVNINSVNTNSVNINSVNNKTKKQKIILND